MVQKVGDKVDQHVDDRHPDHVGLDQRIVAHRDRVHRQFPDAVPHEDALDDGRAAEEAADGERQQRDDREHGRLDHALPEDDPIAHAARLRAGHVILVQLLQHRGAHLPHILGGHGDRQGQGGHQGAFEARPAGDDRQPAQLDGQDLHEQHGHEEVWHGVSDKAQKAQQIIGEAVVPHGGQYAQGDRNHDRRHDGQRRQQQRRRELGGEGLEHVPSGDVARAHIAGQHTAQPGDVLLQKGLVQAQLGALGVNDLLRHAALVAVELRDGVAARDAHHGKGQKRDPDQNRDQLQESLYYIFSHGSRPVLPEGSYGYESIIVRPHSRRKPPGGI